MLVPHAAHGSTPQECTELALQFHLLPGAPEELLPGFVSDRGLGAVVTDFSPLRGPLQALESLRKSLPEDIPLIQVPPHAQTSNQGAHIQTTLSRLFSQIDGSSMFLVSLLPDITTLSSVCESVRFSFRSTCFLLCIPNGVIP